MEPRSRVTEVPAGEQQPGAEKYGEIELQLEGRLVDLRKGQWDGWVDVQFIAA